MVKGEIFNQCCFAGSDTLLSSSLEGSSSSDSPCNLCEEGQFGIDAPVTFNDSETSCAEVYNFLVAAYKEGSNTCTSTKRNLSSACCRDTLAAGESAAFGDFGAIDGSDGKAASDPTEENAPRIIPEDTDLTWNVESASIASSRSSGLFVSVFGFFTFSFFFIYFL